MFSTNLLADLSTQGPLALVCGMLVLGGLALLATMLYVVTAALRRVHAQQAHTSSRCRLTGREAVGRLLAHLGLPAVCVEVGAKLDHYDQLRRRVLLRTESSNSSSVAALAIAAHEVGHAEQFAKGYWAARAARGLLVLLVLVAAVVFVYPFATTIAGTGEVNLTGMLAAFALMALLRLPVSLALEMDATRRGKRLLNETLLADESEREGIAHMLRAGFRAHVVYSVALVVMIGAGVATMWLVENGLSTPAPSGVQIAQENAFETGGPLPQADAINGSEGYALPLVALTVSIITVFWAFSGRARKAPARSPGL
jgi:uncharacterized protein